MLLEEFGKWIKAGTSANLAERDSFYQAVYQEVQNVRTTMLMLHLSSTLLKAYTYPLSQPGFFVYPVQGSP